MSKNEIKNERGAVMLESVFGISVTIIVLALLLSLGFYIYQKSVTTIVANEIAEEVAMTYKYRTVDDCSEITIDDVRKNGWYRNLIWGAIYRGDNETKGEALAQTRLTKTAFANQTSTAEVEIKKVDDDLGKMHYEVTLTQKYEYLFGDLLEMFGINQSEPVSTTVYVQSVDVSNYINTVKTINYAISKTEGALPIVEAISKVINLVKSVINIF